MTPKKILLVILVIAGIAAYIVGSFFIIGIIQGNKSLPFMAKQNTEAATTSLPQQTFRRKPNKSSSDNCSHTNTCSHCNTRTYSDAAAGSGYIRM